MLQVSHSILILSAPFPLTCSVSVLPSFADMSRILDFSELLELLRSSTPPPQTGLQYYDDMLLLQRSFHGPYCYYDKHVSQPNKVFSHQTRQTACCRVIGAGHVESACGAGTVIIEASNARSGAVAAAHLLTLKEDPEQEKLPTIRLSMPYMRSRTEASSTWSGPPLKQGIVAEAALVNVAKAVNQLSRGWWGRGCNREDIWACILTMMVGAEVTDEDWLKVQQVMTVEDTITPLFRQLLED
jgi:hypothetical protein